MPPPPPEACLVAPESLSASQYLDSWREKKVVLTLCSVPSTFGGIPGTLSSALYGIANFICGALRRICDFVDRVGHDIVLKFEVVDADVMGEM